MTNRRSLFVPVVGRSPNYVARRSPDYMTVRQALADARRELAEAGIDDDALEAEVLLRDLLDTDRARFYRDIDAPLSEAQLAHFQERIQRRLGGEPTAYILGRREFYGLTFEVGPGVLIPRPETETLVEATLAAIRAHPRSRRAVRVADVGVGCGAVALAVAKHAPTASVFATENSPEALACADRNRERLGLTGRVVLLAGELLEPVPEPLDVVTANLPYVPTAEYEALPPEIRDHEPRAAVDGGEDGLDLIRALARELTQHLAPEASVLLEVGSGQAGVVSDLLTDAIGGEERTHRDLLGIRRVVEVRLRYE